MVEHVNDVRDKSRFRTARHTNPDILREPTTTFEAFHNARHRYSAHHGASPDEMRTGLTLHYPPDGYQPPQWLPAKGRIEAVRYVRSDGLVNLWGHKIKLPDKQTYQYVTAIISVRAKQLRIITRHNEIIHAADFNIHRHLPKRKDVLLVTTQSSLHYLHAARLRRGRSAVGYARVRRTTGW